MPEFEYVGPCPAPDASGVLVHPGEVAEFDSDPPDGAWRPVPSDAEEPAAAAAAPAAPEAKPPAPAPPPAPAAPPAASPSASEGKQA